MGALGLSPAPRGLANTHPGLIHPLNETDLVYDNGGYAANHTPRTQTAHSPRAAPDAATPQLGIQNAPQPFAKLAKTKPCPPGALGSA